MADREQLYTALRNADAAGDVEGARKLASYIQSMPAESKVAEAPKGNEHGMLANLGMGAVRGVKDVIDTGAQLLSSGFDKLAGTREGERVKAMNDAGNADFKKEYGDSTAASIGRVGGNIAATLPVGGVLGAGAKTLGASPAIVNALTTSGMRAGTTPGALNMLTRAAGGAVTGGVSAGLVNPDDAGTGAAIGAAMPPVLAGAGKVANYAGRAAGSVIKPFTAAGQDEIAGNVIRRFAEGGPTASNTAQIVPGSVPTLAEATGNAGLATLQRGTRDLRPNAFVEREQLNAAARNTAFDQTAGDAAQLEFYKASRSQAADELYKKALEADPSGNLTAYLKGQITQLLKRPSVNDASKTAQRWAMERGEKPAADGSLTALHDVKQAIDDKIAAAVRQGAGGEVKALQATKDKLLNVMEKLSPDYAEARTTYAEMSKPINAMETLQGLKLRDSQGNITLAKVQTALQSLQAQMNAPGAKAAKSVTQEQMATLTAIRDDLMRQSNLGLGKSIGSNTFQNLATDNILNSVAGNTLSRFANKTGVAGLLGQAGRLAYSGPNEAIRNRLVDMMLQPQLAQNALAGPALSAPNPLMRLATNPTVAQPVYRAAPVLSASR